MGAPKGNNNASKESRMFTNALRRFYTQNPEKLLSIIVKMDAKAQDGDIATAREIMDRVDGKPAQAIELSTTSNNIDTLSDAELAAIAAGSGGEAATPAPGTQTVN